MSIRFPSVSSIFSESKTTFLRFPFVIVVAVAGSLCTLWLVEITWQQDLTGFDMLSNFAWATALGISVLLAFTTMGESRGWSTRTSLFVNTIALILLLVYWFFLPGNFEPSGTEAFYRYLLFLLAAHLFVSFSPFLNNTDVDAFWEYNKTLFLRILTAALFTGVLFAGLAIALVSLDNLLGIEIKDRRYLQLWIVLAGIFNTWFFLSGVPRPGKLQPGSVEYPKGLKVFVQYILIPLVTIYILILYLYTGKIMLEWQWPNGWVANLVLSFSIAGILSLLLLHPIKDQEKNRWVNIYTRYYYLALIPLVVLLMLSIWVRIAEYGVTVNRFFVATLGVWLAGLVIYFIFGKAKNIKVIPISLGLIALLISFGPQGAFEVTKRSQLDRFEQLLEDNGMLSENDKAIPATDTLSFDDQQQMSSIIYYMLTLKGPDALQPYFDEDLAELLQKDDHKNNYSDAEQIAGLLGIEYIHNWRNRDPTGQNRGYFNFSLEPGAAIPVGSYDFYLGSFSFFDEINREPKTSGDAWEISYQKEELSLTILEVKTGNAIKVELKPDVEKLLGSNQQRGHTQNQVPLQELTLQDENEFMRVKTVIRTISGYGYPDEITTSNLSIEIFVSSKDL